MFLVVTRTLPCLKLREPLHLSDNVAHFDSSLVNRKILTLIYGESKELASEHLIHGPLRPVKRFNKNRVTQPQPLPSLACT